MNLVASNAENDAEPARAGVAANPAPTTAACFPLEATPFERYLAADTRPGYPMSFTIEANLAGEVDPGRLNEAIGSAWRVHPLLSGRLVGRGWRHGGGASPELETRDTSDPIDPAREAPLRLRWRSGQAGGVLSLTVHHAVCDGLGAIGYLRDTVAAYNGAPPAPISPTEVEALRRRGWVDRSGLSPVPSWQAYRFFAKELWRFATTRPAALVSSQADVAPARLRTVRLDRESVNALSRALRPAGASLNTGLLACAFAAAAKSNCLRRRGSVVRVTTPFNLRDASDRPLTAANKIGYAFLDRRLAEIEDPADLIPGLQEEVNTIQKWKLAACFSDALARVGAIPGGLWAATRLSGCVSTLVLSNVGDPRRRRRGGARGPGDVELTAVRGAPPVRPGTALSLGVSAYEGGLLLTAERDPARLSEADTDALLLSIGGACRRLAGAPGEPGEVLDGFP